MPQRLCSPQLINEHALTDWARKAELLPAFTPTYRLPAKPKMHPAGYRVGQPSPPPHRRPTGQFPARVVESTS